MPKSAKDWNISKTSKQKKLNALLSFTLNHWIRMKDWNIHVGAELLGRRLGFDNSNGAAVSWVGASWRRVAMSGKDTNHTSACSSANCMTFIEEYTKWALKIRLWELLLKWRDCQYLQSDAWAHPDGIWVHRTWMAEYMEHSLPLLCLMKNKMGRAWFCFSDSLCSRFFQMLPNLVLTFQQLLQIADSAQWYTLRHKTEGGGETDLFFPKCCRFLLL